MFGWQGAIVFVVPLRSPARRSNLLLAAEGRMDAWLAVGKQCLLAPLCAALYMMASPLAPGDSEAMGGALDSEQSPSTPAGCM